MVQTLLESKLAIASKAEAVPVRRPGDPSPGKSLEALWATCLGDSAALAEIATTLREGGSLSAGEWKGCVPKMLMAALFVTVEKEKSI